MRTICRLSLITVQALLLSPSMLTAQTGPPGPQPVIQDVVKASRTAVPKQTDVTLQTLSQSRRWKDVLDLADSRVHANPSDAEALFWLGTARFQLDDAIGALRALRSAQRIGMDTAELHIELGQAYYRLNQFFLFEEQMRRARQLDPSNGTPLYLLGFYQLSVKSDAGRALVLLREAAKLHREDPKVLYELGYSLEVTGQAKEAEVYYRKAIDLVSKNKQAFAWPLQGMARLLLNDDPLQALRFAKDAVAMQPQEATNHVVLAKVYDRLGDLPLAAREAQQATVENPTSAATRYLLYRLYRRQGETELAEQQLHTFEEINAIYGPE